MSRQRLVIKSNKSHLYEFVDHFCGRLHFDYRQEDKKKNGKLISIISGTIDLWSNQMPSAFIFALLKDLGYI